LEEPKEYQIERHIPKGAKLGYQYICRQNNETRKKKHATKIPTTNLYKKTPQPRFVDELP
jgi:hypothetical protein